jgi:hypothetical protein
MSIGKTTDLNIVTSAQIAAGAVGSAAIAAASVGTAAISSGAATSGQVLQANGSGAVTFATPAAGGGMTLISTATPSAATSLSFTSIPGTYKHLLVLYCGVFQSVTNGYWSVRLNSDTAVGKHEWNSLCWNGSAADGRSNETTGFGDTGNHAPIGFTANTSQPHNAIGEFWVYNYTITTTPKHVKWIASGSATGGTSQHSNTATGRYITTGTAVTQLDFIRSSTQTITGTFYLYGVS